MCPPADAVIVVSMPINASSRRPARTTMQAIVQHAYGSTDVLRHQDVDPSTPGRCEVRARMHAASIDQEDWFVTTGRPQLRRVGHSSASAATCRSSARSANFRTSSRASTAASSAVLNETVFSWKAKPLM